MTEAVQVALIVALPALVTSLSASIGVILQNSKHQKINTASLSHITVLTNSTLTAANKRIDELEAEIKGLRVKSG